MSNIGQAELDCQYNMSWRSQVQAPWAVGGLDESLLSSDNLAESANSPFNRVQRELRGRPPLAVLDTNYVRTGLDFQLRKGSPPASIALAQGAALRS